MGWNATLGKEIVSGKQNLANDIGVISVVLHRGFGTQVVKAKDKRVLLANGGIVLDGRVTLLHELKANIAGGDQLILVSGISKMADQGHE